MAWVVPLLCAGIVLGVLLLLARGVQGARELAITFVLVGLAGYAWQGRPGLPASRPVKASGDQVQGSIFAGERKLWFETLGPDAQALDTADGFIRNGDPDYAAGVLRGELSRRPESAMLWIGYGNALTAYADGMVTPAARFAFRKGAALSPDSPAAAYFLALALAQSGDLDGADAIWRAILPTAPRPIWRALIAEKLAVVERLRTGG